MELIRGVTNLRQDQRGCVVTIGTYDGIHLGHQALLRRLHEHAGRLSRPSMLLTFEPMPREFLKRQDPPARLTSWRERWRILERMNLDYLCLLRFSEALRNLSGEEFAQLLARELDAEVVVVGHDFRFGRDLGFPTANLQIERRRAPVAGIFAVRVRGIAGTPLAGVASLGTRPTVAGVDVLLEAHVFDFSGDLYGREIEVEFVAKLRDE